MKKIDKPRLLLFAALCAGVSLLYALFIRDGTPHYRLINSLFAGSLPALLPGLFMCVKNMGMFDLFVYGFRLLRRYKKNFEDEARQRPETYHDFKLERTPDPRWREPTFAGGVFMLASVILTFFYP